MLQGEAVVSWVNAGILGAFAYKRRHAACRGVLWRSLGFGGNTW